MGGDACIAGHRMISDRRVRHSTQSQMSRRVQVLLLGGNASIAGYAAQGSLYTGAGYWAPVPDLAAALADMSVRSLVWPRVCLVPAPAWLSEDLWRPV